MRRQTTLIYLIFGGIVVIFAVSFGPGSSMCVPQAAHPPYLAKVDNELVRQQEFMLLYRAQVAYLRELSQKSGEQFDDAMLERLGLGRHVFDQLVDVKLLARDFLDLGLAVGDEQLSRFLDRRYGVGAVDFDTYRRWVREQHDMSVERFEADAAQWAAAEQMKAVFAALTPASDADAELDFRSAHDRVKVSFVRFDLDRSKQPRATAAQEDTILAVDPAEVESLWKADPLAYRAPLRLQLRRWSRPLPAASADGPGPDPQARGRVDAELAALAQRLAGGAGDPNQPAEAGDDLGWLEAENLPTAAATELLALQPGEVTRPHPEGPTIAIYRVESREEARRLPFEEVRRRVANDLWVERAAVAASRGPAERLLADLGRGRPLAALTTAPGAHGSLPERHESDWLLRHAASLPGLGESEEVAQALFALPPSAADAPPQVLARAYRVHDSIVVVVATARELPDAGKLAGERLALRELRRQAWRPAMLRDHLAERRERAKIVIHPRARQLVGSGIHG